LINGKEKKKKKTQTLFSDRQLKDASVQPKVVVTQQQQWQVQQSSQAYENKHAKLQTLGQIS